MKQEMVITYLYRQKDFITVILHNKMMVKRKIYWTLFKSWGMDGNGPYTPYDLLFDENLQK